MRQYFEELVEKSNLFSGFSEKDSNYV